MFKNIYINRSMSCFSAAVMLAAVMVLAGCVTVSEGPGAVPVKPYKPQVETNVSFMSEWGNFEEMICGREILPLGS